MVPHHLRRVNLWILLRITLSSKLIRALNGHSARKIKQPTFFQRPLGTAWLLLDFTAWLRQRNMSFGRGECAYPGGEFLVTNYSLCLPPQFSLQLCKHRGLCKKCSVKTQKEPLLLGPTVKLLEAFSSLFLLSPGHGVRVVRSGGLQPSGAPGDSSLTYIVAVFVQSWRHWREHALQQIRNRWVSGMDGRKLQSDGNV